jgi:hypothetical protein
MLDFHRESLHRRWLHPDLSAGAALPLNHGLGFVFY